MAAHLGQRITLAQLAEHVDVGVPHLVRLFRCGDGRPPHATLRLMRLAKAAELLSASTLAVKEVAAVVGYGDVPDFVRDFARAYGTSPLRYRRRCKAMILNPAV